MTCRDVPSLFWAQAVASLGLVPGHLSLYCPEATVQTHKDRKRPGPRFLTLVGVDQVRGVGRSLSWKESHLSSRCDAPFDVAPVGSRNSRAILPCPDGTVHLPNLMRVCTQLVMEIEGVGAWVTVCG